MSASKYEELCSRIESCLGGKENVEVYTHCITRLRFNLKDKEKVNQDVLKDCPGVVNALWSGQQFQVVIGPDVTTAFAEVQKVLGDISSESSASSSDKDKKFSFMSVLETISGCITPCIPLLIGSGMIQVILLLLSMAGILSTESDTYAFFNFIANTAFYFLPVYVGAASARKFGLNIWYGMFFGAMLIHPTFTALTDAASSAGITFATSALGVPVYSATYSSTIFPAIFSVFLASKVYKIADKYCPALFKSVLVPMITMLVVAPITFWALAPVGAFVGVYLTSFIIWLYNMTGFIGVGVMCCLLPLMVTCGMHHATSPYIFQSLADRGFDPVVMPANVVNNINIGMVCLAISLRTKQKELKSQAATCGVSALVGGISEPALYGIVLQLRKPMIPLMISNFVSGCILGLFHSAGYVFAGSYGIFGMVIFINGSMSAFLYACLGIIIGAIVAFVVTLVLYKETGKQTASDTAPVSTQGTSNTASQAAAPAAGSVMHVLQPVEGYVIPLNEIEDEVFSSGMAGNGCGIQPTGENVISPVNGTVSVVAGTKHAVGIVSDDGLEMLVHVGLDTVTMEGKGFTTYVKPGDHVKAGQKLLSFSKSEIEKAGFSTTTAVLVTNAAQYENVSCLRNGLGKIGDDLITVC